MMKKSGHYIYFNVSIFDVENDDKVARVTTELNFRSLNNNQQKIMK